MVRKARPSGLPSTSQPRRQSLLAQLHPDTRHRLLAYVGAVGFIGPAARAVGLSERTVRWWVAKGTESATAIDDAWARIEAGELDLEVPEPVEPYHTFALDVADRQGAMVVQALSQISAAAAADWKAAAWLASKLDPIHFGDRVVVAGDAEAPVVVQPSAPIMTAAEYYSGVLDALADFRRSQGAVGEAR